MSGDYGMKGCWCSRGALCSTYDMCEERLVDLERIKIRAAAKAQELEAKLSKDERG